MKCKMLNYNAISTVLYGVTIGNNVIIGAGSLVNKNIPDGVVAAGVPCKIIGKFDTYKSRFTTDEYLLSKE